MLSLRMIETGGGVLIAEHTTSHLFATPPRSERYPPSRWPYGSSVVLHAMALVSVVSLARYLTPPPPRPTPAPPIQHVTNVFVLPKFGVDNTLHRRARQTQPSKRVPVAVVGDVAAAPVPAALGDSRVADTSSIPDEQPPKSAAGPPIPAIPASDASLPGRRRDPSEAGLGSATAHLRGSSTAKVRHGGPGDGSSRDARKGGSVMSVSPATEDS